MGDITNNNRQVSILVPDGASYESVLPKTVASAVDTTTANVTVQDHIDDTTIHNSTTAIEGMISTALEDYTPTSELATVATTGDYDDLLDKPTIGSATITIQKNSTKVDDFSVNATSDKSINITVPVNVTDLADASSYYTSSQVDSAIATAVSSVYRYKGSVSTYSQLPSTGNVAGDVYNVEDTGANYAWTGTAWDKLSDDLTNYVTLNGTQTLKNKTIAIADNTITGLSTVATSGDYNDLSNKPTIGNAKLTIQKNSVKVGEFTANATTDKTLDITVPTTVAELTDSNDYAKTADLATVATSGDYDDLLDKPTIGNATLTIQKNGTKVDDFSANATSNKTVNITVPTDNAELTNGAGYAKSADLATVATSGNYSDLSGTPTIGEATLTIQKNGTNIKTFSANATSNVTANITVPTDNSELTNGAGYAVASSLATVATSGSYADLSNKPTIGNAEIEIQKNGTKVDSFTTNQTGEKQSINITVPTAVSELTNDTGFITGVAWNDVTDKPSTFTPSAHNQASSTINVMTGYSKPTETSAISTSDTLNSAIGKLEKALDGKQASGDYATHSDVSTALQDYTPTSGLATVATSGDYDDLLDKPTIGNATLTIQKNGTTVKTFSANATSNVTANITVPTTASDVGALPSTTTINDLTSTAQQNALNSGATSTLIGKISTNETAISTINGKIPSAASSTNQLADKDFVNSSISTNTATFDGSWDTYALIPTTAQGFIDAGFEAPTNNNYLVVKEDETQDGGTWRYKYASDSSTYSKSNWKVEYEVNETPMTDAQLAALNSGATSTLIGKITTNETAIGTINTTIGGYGNIVTHNTSEFATSTQGGKADTALQPNDNISELTNDAGYITGVAWDDVTSKPSTFTPSAHNQASNTINVMTGYSKPSSTSAIGTSDTLNAAIGKLEKALDGKQASGNYVPTSRKVNNKALSSDITLTASDVGALPDSTVIPTITDTYSGTSSDGMSGKAVASALSSYVPTSRTINSKALTGNITLSASDVGAAATSHNQASNTINAMTGYDKTAGTATGIVATDTLNVALAKIEQVLDTKQTGGNYVPTSRKVNNKALSSDITLTASDVGALPDSTVIPTITDTYSSTSSDGMSGKAVASAVSEKQDSSTAVTHTASTKVGDTNKPVYVASNGAATVCSYELNKSVPSDAVFTDTTYSDMVGADATTAGSSGLVPAPAAGKQGSFLRGDGTWQTPSNTKNTAGSTDTSSKIFLVGATSQAANPQTYSHDTVFVDANGRLNSAAPASDANDTTVATTKWVKDQSYVPTTRTVNGKALSSDITLSASDVSALPSSTVIPTTTDSVTSGSSAALTSGGAYTNLVRRKSTSAATGSASQGVYVDANGQVQTCDAVTSTYSATGTAPVNGTAVKSAIDAAIASVYKPAGSVAFASLPTPAKSLEGNVYDVTDAFTTDSKFVTSGQSYPAGTNVVVINTTGTTYKYDVLAGFVDLSGYVPTTRKVNNKALSADISLTASDVGAAATSHTHTTADVTALTGYTIASTASAIASTDSLNTALGKIQKSIDGKQASGSYVTYTASTAVGSATKPAYVNSSGVATACSYELNKSVPSDAVFTDTTYSDMVGADGTTAGSSGLVPAPAATANGKYLRGDGTWQTPTNTKNTAGSTDTSSKIFLIGATSQAASPQTYSHDTAFVDTNGRLNSAAPASDANDTTVATTKWVKDQGYTSNTGTITGITMNGSSKGTSGVVDLGTVLTSHQTIKQDGITGATINRFGTCSIAAATAAKTVSVTNGTFALETGASVRVKFSNANTASTPTLDVNSTGAKNIFHRGAQITTGSNKALLAGVCDFVYDGTQYHLVGNYYDSDTKNTAGSTDTSSKIFLVGATSQAANPQTYSHDTAFVDTNGRLNSAAPASGANDTTVATTKWVKDQSYVTSSTKATTSALGLVKPDGTTITVDSAGTISAVQDTMTMVVDEFTMASAGTTITLSSTPASKALCWVNICNTDIVASEWSLSGNTITLSTSIPADTWGQVRYFTNVGGITASSPLLKAKSSISSGALTLQASKKYYETTVAGNTTFTITAPSTSDVIEFYLHITHTSGTITFPTSVKWASTPTFTSGKKHLIKMLSFDGGSTYLAQLEGSFS